MENFFSILGGMGTMATESFVRLINHRTKATKDQEYLNYVLFNHATVPDRTAYILDRSEENPMPFLLDDIEKQNLLQPN
ncbi:amino acid racemase, partial [Enterococcus faecalis]